MSLSLLHRGLPLAVGLAAILSAAPAAAQTDLQPGFDRRLLALAPARGGAENCWLRRYDAAHLASHPLQTVEAIGICVRVERLAEEKPLRYRYEFDFAVKVKGKPKVARTSGECGWAYRPADQPAPAGTRIGCGVECDGGGVEIETRPNGSLMLYLDNRIRVSGGCGSDDDDEAASFDLTAGVDDRIFAMPKENPAAFRTFSGKRAR